MLIIGERINTSRAAVRNAVLNRDGDYILNEAVSQARAGAAVIDVNCGTSMEKEAEDMLWMMDVIQRNTDIRLSIDSPDHEVVKKALAAHKGTAIVNSITAEKARYEQILPGLGDSDALVVALTMDEKGMPSTAGERFELATILMEICRGYGISKERLLIDPLIRPVSAEPAQAKEVLEAINLIKGIGLKTIAGVSNISFGLPNRKLINRTFLAMAIAAGLDACIMDPLDAAMMSSSLASDAIMGRDEYSMGYIAAFREKRLVG
ncbi:MAG: dihydropteroate synthase [Candidatus Omnitrophota bacterium]